MGRMIAIGDIHGCELALSTLLDEVGPRADDKIIQLGDMIDRGPNSAGVIEQLIALSNYCSVVVVQGNHEETISHVIVCRCSTLDGRWCWSLI